MGWKDVDWQVTGWFIFYHIVILTIVPLYFIYATVQLSTVIAAIVLFFFTGIAISAGYHRLYSHQAYRASRWVEVPLLFLGSMTLQGSVLPWAAKHRLHHRHVDTEKDPYSINEGFWHAHMFWFLKKQQPFDKRLVPDLMKNKLLLFQYKYTGWVQVGSNVIVTLLLGWLLNDFLGAFVLAWWLRVFVVHHCTWLINSAAHYCGSQTYSKEHSAVDNYIMAFFTWGEGYHNYHHTFAADYRNGVKWYHYDPSKWMLWTLEKLGLVSELRYVNKYTIKRRLISEDAKHLLDRLKKSVHSKRVTLEKQVQELSARLTKQAALLSERLRDYQKLRAKRADKARLKAKKSEIKSLRRSIRHDWRAWSRVCRTVYKLQPAP